MAMPDLQQYPWNLYLINNMGDIVVFLDCKMFYYLLISVYFPAVEMRKSLLKKNRNWK